jgi:hypothetical protein
LSKTIIVLGRGHSGSRLISSFFVKNGWYPGEKINISMDKAPWETLLKEWRQLFKGWHTYKIKTKNWSIALGKDSVEQFKHKAKRIIDEYMKDIYKANQPLNIVKNDAVHFFYPWFMILYPDYYYLWWTRSISKKNEHSRGNRSDNYLKKICGGGNIMNYPWQSWKLYYELIKTTHRAFGEPKHYLHMRFEDFVLNHDLSVQKLEFFTGEQLHKRFMPMTKKQAMEAHNRKKSWEDIQLEYLITDRIHNDHENLDDPILRNPMKDLGYIK